MRGYIENALRPESIAAPNQVQQHEATEMLEKLKLEIIATFEPFLIKEIPSALQDYVSELHKVNTERLARMGQEYTPPTILFIDGWKTLLSSHNKNPIGHGSGRYFAEINTCLVSVNTSLTRSSRLSRAMSTTHHELSHSASYHQRVVKFNPAINDTQFDVLSHGGRLTSIGDHVGEWIDEGHLTAEGEIVRGMTTPFTDPDFDSLPKLNKLFPNQKWLVREKKPGLRSFLPDIYRCQPELYELGKEYIYQGKIVQFARAVDRAFGKGFFIDLNYPSVKGEDVYAMAKRIRQRINELYPDVEDLSPTYWQAVLGFKL